MENFFPYRLVGAGSEQVFLEINWNYKAFSILYVSKDEDFKWPAQIGLVLPSEVKMNAEISICGVQEAWLSINYYIFCLLQQYFKIFRKTH